MTTQSFSIVRRRPNLLDVVFPKQTDVVGYRLRGATSFSGTFNDLFTANIGRGHIDSSINRSQIQSLPGFGRVRAVFDPDNYTGGSGIADATQFWLRFRPVDAAGTPGDEEPPVLVLTEHQRRSSSLIQITGTAPVEATVADSLQVCLGNMVRSLRINNTGSNPLFVALEAGGPEIQIAATSGVYDYGTHSQTDQIFVRATGGTTTMTATFTVAGGHYLEV